MLDLHTHSTFSDGTDSPEQIIDKCLERKIKYLAITDHDNIDANEIAFNYSKDKDINFISGIEFSVNYKGGIFHLLGLNIDWNNRAIIDYCTKLKKHRTERVKIMCDRLKNDGFPVDYYKLVDRFRESQSLGRPHIAQILIENGYAKNIQQVFKKYLGGHTQYYEPKKNIEFIDAVKLIHNAKGFAVLAHPLSLNLSWDNLEKFLLEKKLEGLDGVEVFHSGYSVLRCKFLDKLCNKIEIAKTAGSDYHGDIRKEVKLGKDSNGKNLTLDYLPDYLKKSSREN